jgi:ankyrin repeat protein
MRTLRWIGSLAVTVLLVNGYSAYGSVDLVDAVKNGDKQALRALIKQRVNVNAAEPDGATALHWAVHRNDLEAVELLLRAGADPRTANRYGATPLAIAAEGAGGSIVEKLIEAGADPNTLVTPYGQTVLMTAARYGALDAVRVLLTRGAYVDARETNRGQTALMWAAAEGHADIIKLLMEHGADHRVRSQDRDTTGAKLVSGTPVAVVLRGGLTALLFAARQGRLEAVRSLLDGGAEIGHTDSDGNTALNLAILNTHYDVAQYLLDRGADPNAANREGRTALFTAVEMYAPNWSPLPARQEMGRLTAMDIIRSLIAKGADVNARLAAPSPIEKVAFDHGDRTLAAGATPFMLAARSASLGVMRLLLENGADPKLGHEKGGLNALMLASGLRWNNNVRGTEEQALETVKILTELGLDVNSETDTGETPLHGAASRGADSIVKYLAEKGAKLDAKNKDGKMPVDLAAGGGDRPSNAGTVALLRQLMGLPAEEPAQSQEQKATTGRQQN